MGAVCSQALRATTIRLVLVPLALLLTPQQLAVLVKDWVLIITPSGSRGRPAMASST